MGGFRLGGMTLSSLFKKPETVRYPFEKKPAPPGLKGHVGIDESACILCGMCQRTCPSDAIVVEKPQRVWSIDPFRCVQCSSCVRACPKSCLTMLPSYPTPTPSQSCVIVYIPEAEKGKPHAPATDTDG